MACNCASNMREKIDDTFFGNQWRMIKRFEREGEKVLLNIKDDHTKFLMKVILFFLSNTLNQKKEDQSENDKSCQKTVNATIPLKIDAVTKENDKPSVSNSITEVKDDGKVNGKQIENQEICWAYKFNKCHFKNGKGCPKRHPERCVKFCDYGHIAKDMNGCDTKNCVLLHPKLCRNSTALKECPYKHCKFQHLKGTKIVQMRRYGTASYARERNVPENEKIEVLIRNFDKFVETMTKLIEHSEMEKESARESLPDNFRLPNR